MALGDTLYYLIGGSPRIFYTSNPDIDNWKELTAKFSYGTADPAFFKDDISGKVYIYWGCSDVDPIMGVEVNPADGFKAIGVPKALIEHRGELYGWEVPGKNNDEDRPGWNEGPCMIEYNGKYYLQYAAPGTEFRIYGDGVYVGDTPLGPFTYMENNPFCIKPGGFIGASGHGHTFKDKYGNLWHVASMRISVRHSFERRLGLFPVFFDGDRLFSHTVLTDYPFAIPDSKTDFKSNNLSLNWNLLSYNKPTRASTTLAAHVTKYACDEQIETWWSARTGNPDEWFQVDLQTPQTIHAIQVNFADEGVEILASPGSYMTYKYIIQSSDDASNWTNIADKSLNTADSPHELLVLDQPVTARYLRITNKMQMEGKFSLSGFRVFGNGNGEAPQRVTSMTVRRNTADTRRYQLNWEKVPDATGYIVHWGVDPQQLFNATMVYTNQLEAGFFNRDSQYWFSVDAFNENGIATANFVADEQGLGKREPTGSTLSVFPNPTDGLFHVNTPSAGTVSLQTLSGKSLFSQHVENEYAAFDLSGYLQGIYLLSYTSEQNSASIKLIKK
jgi:hypothetical protein